MGTKGQVLPLSIVVVYLKRLKKKKSTPRSNFKIGKPQARYSEWVLWAVSAPTDVNEGRPKSILLFH